MGVLPPLNSPFLIYFLAFDLAMAVYFCVSGYPLPPGLLESWDYGHTTTKIFELEGLTCKIFRTKELAGLCIISRLTVQLHD
jgi:hypothetical protein